MKYRSVPFCSVKFNTFFTYNIWLVRSISTLKTHNIKMNSPLLRPLHLADITPVLENGRAISANTQDFVLRLLQIEVQLRLKLTSISYNTPLFTTAKIYIVLLTLHCTHLTRNLASRMVEHMTTSTILPTHYSSYTVGYIYNT
jgi:hypothetical protein